MPLYEYACEACGHRFEKIQKFSDALVEECPKCGAMKVHKLVSSPAIQFKGSGWYITDYAKKGTAGTDGSQTAENKSPDGKGEKAEKAEKGSAKDDKPAPAPATAASSSGDSTTPSGSSSSKT